VKNSVKAMNKHAKGFEHLTETLLKLSDTKLKEAILSGPQNHEIIKDDPSENLLTETEKSAWLKFKVVCLSFLGRIVAENYKELV